MTDSMLMICAILSPFAAGLLTFILGKMMPSKEVISAGKKKAHKSGQNHGEGHGHTELSNARDWFAIVFCWVILGSIAWLAYQVLDYRKEITAEIPEICGFGLHFIMDGFRAVYSLVAAFMWACVALLSREYFKHHGNVSRFYMFLLWTFGATLGVFLSADLMTTFIFFEIMSFTSYVWVAQEENRPSLKAAETYLAVAVIGGLVMLMGIFLLYYRIGTLNIEALILHGSNDPYMFAAGICMLVGFGAKAGAFPLHIWLPKAHPVAPAPASALLSGILTKTGIYGTLILSCRLFHNNATWGMLILSLGVVTMFGGALLAVFSIDLKRTLACSSMSQIGFIMIGIGMQDLLEEENQLALQGTMLHMMNHSMIKLVLFMAAGVIYQNLHALDLNVIRGFGRKKNFLKIVFLIGALAIGGIPFFSGYISKTLLHESIVEYGGGTLFKVIEWIFLISGGMTVAYMTKLFVAIFVEKNKDAKLQKTYDEQKNYLCKTSAFALGISAAALFIFGICPYKLMTQAAVFGESFLGAEYEEHHLVHFFSGENLKGAMISITIGALLYFFIIRKLLMVKGAYVNRWPAKLDLEELLYRPILLGILPLFCGIVCRVFDSMLDTIVVFLRKTFYRDTPLPYERPEGNALSAFIGGICNDYQDFANRTYRKNNPTNKDYVHIMAVKNTAFKESNTIIQRSLSFGLLLFCFGLAVVLIYIILL